MKRMSAQYTRTKCMWFWKSHLQLKRISRQKGKVLFKCISPVSQTSCMRTIFETSNIGIVPCTRVKSAGCDAQAYTREPLHKIICCWVLFPFFRLCIAAPSSQTKSKRQRSWHFFGLTAILLARVSWYMEIPYKATGFVKHTENHWRTFFRDQRPDNKINM